MKEQQVHNDQKQTDKHTADLTDNPMHHDAGDRMQSRTDHRTDNIVDFNQYVLLKQIGQLLSSLNPHMKSTNIKDHFRQLTEGMISKHELYGFDFQIKMRKWCRDLEEVLPGSKAAIIFFNSHTQTAKIGAAPSMSESFEAFIHAYNESNRKPVYIYDNYIEVYDFFEDESWEPYRNYLRDMDVRTCWRMPIYSQSNILCFLTLYFTGCMKPNHHEVEYIVQKKAQFNQLIKEYPSDFPSLWFRHSI